MRRPFRPILAAGALTVALTACGDSTDPDDDPLPDNAATAVGLTVRDNVEASFDAFFPARLLQPLSTGAADTPCVTPMSSTETDGDGVPDDAFYNFTAPPCEDEVRGFTLGVVGQLRIVDPEPEVAGFGAAISLIALRFDLSAEDESDTSYSLTRNGTLTLTGSAAGLEQATELQVFREFPGFSDAAVELQWTIGFAPEATLQINQPLPSGSVTVAGSVGWTRGSGSGSENFDLTVTTATPLHYDASCESSGQRFDDGELRVAGTFGETPGYVRITWDNCGEDPGIGFVTEE